MKSRLLFLAVQEAGKQKFLMSVDSVPGTTQHLLLQTPEKKEHFVSHQRLGREGLSLLAPLYNSINLHTREGPCELNSSHLAPPPTDSDPICLCYRLRLYTLKMKTLFR